MERDILVYIDDILESIEKIFKYTKGIKLENFLMNVEKQDSVIRRLEIIGEAAKHIPNSYREKYTDIPWKKISGLRDILIHEYFGINLKMTWKVIIDDLPELNKKLLKLKEEI